MTAPLVRLTGVVKQFGSTVALDRIDAAIRPGRITGLVGPDGAGKTTLLRLIDGLLAADAGQIEVCGLDPVRSGRAVHERAAYMPQRFGLYEELTVIENLTLYADLRDVHGAERRQAFGRLLEFTDLGRFQERPARNLSGGMKQKLGLACALVREPQLLLLDEPSVGVDPVSRRELWRMMKDLVGQGITVVWSTSYLDEAERCDEVLLLNDGRLLHDGPPGDLVGRLTGQTFLVGAPDGETRRLLAQALARPEIVDGVVQGRSIRLVTRPGQPPEGLGDATIRPTPARFEDAFIDLLGGIDKTPSPFLAEKMRTGPAEASIEAIGLTKIFGGFTATDGVGFTIARGEIFGLLGPNGAGKSTIFKMMCGLLRPTSGTARVAGLDLYSAASAARARIGYMAQRFSLYGDLSVRQNLAFFAGIYGLAGRARRDAMARMVETFHLAPYLDRNAGDLPLGFKQRLSLACAVMHEPAVLFLDEPTSGVDPLTRRQFWGHINALVERGVTVMVTTHFLDEAESCDRIGLVYRGRLIALGSPDEIKQSVRDASRPDPTLEDAFIALVEAHDRQLAA